jgi:HSP20 family protein
MQTHAPHRLLDRVFADVDRSTPRRETAQAWRPAFDVVETDEAYEVSLDLPGVGREDVEVGFEDRVLTVRGRRQPPELAEGQRAVRRGRVHGDFTRRLGFRDDVNVEGIEAACRDGVLRVTLPKREEREPRQIPIAVH